MSRRDTHKTWRLCATPLILALMAMPVSAIAQNSGKPTSATQLLQINEEIAVYSARLERIKLEAELAAREAEISKLRIPETSNGSSAVTPGTHAPVIGAIEGMDGNLQATFIFANGNVQTARTGEVIKDAWKVLQITHTSVLLGREEQTVRIGFGRASPDFSAAAH